MKREKGALRGMHHCFRLQDDQKGTKEPYWFYSSLSPQKTSFVFITKVSYSVSSRHSFSDVSTLAIVPLWVGYYWTEHNEARISVSTSFSGGPNHLPHLTVNIPGIEVWLHSACWHRKGGTEKWLLMGLRIWQELLIPRPRFFC